jgi:hypothetical protein
VYQTSVSGRAAGTALNHHRVTKSATQYEYYISYFGVERRNDRWVMGNMLREDELAVKADEVKYDKAQIAEKEVEKKNFLYNPVHGTMD